MAWPQNGDDDESDSDEESDGESSKKSKNGKPEPDLPCRVGEKLTDEMIKKVSDMGYPISEEGLQKLLWLDQEQENRDPDAHDMYIYNDFSGYGTTEVFANMVRTFTLAEPGDARLTLQSSKISTRISSRKISRPTRSGPTSRGSLHFYMEE